MFSEQILAWKSHSDGKPLAALAHQHDVAGVLHPCLRNQRYILNISHAAHRSSAPRWSVHAASVELNHALFIWNSAQPNAVVIRIVFRAFGHAQSGVERVATAFQKCKCIVQIIESIISADNNRALARGTLSIACLRAGTRIFFLSLRSNSSSHSSQNGCLHKITARESHS